MKSNALISCVRQNNTALVELLVSNHSDIEPLLGASFRSCLTSDNITAARVLLNQSQKKSIILNEKGDQNYNVLLYALQRQTDECLKFIVEELAIDHARSKAPAVDENKSRESSYSRHTASRKGSTLQSPEYRSDDEDELKAMPLFDDDDENGDIHPMYFMTTDTKNNIFHELMKSPEGAQSQLAVLEGVLNKEQIQKMV